MTHGVLSTAVRPSRNGHHKAEASTPDFRTELAEKIFLDRYALKDTQRITLTVGDLVVYCPNWRDDEKNRRREIGTVAAIKPGQVVITPRAPDAEQLTVPFDHIDKPLETKWADLCERVAAAIAAVELTPEARSEAETNFRHVLQQRQFIPAGRILAGAGTGTDLTFFNCFVLKAPCDSRAGIIETANRQLETMSRGGGVGIPVSSLRPRYDYVKGVNGRSSGAVSWGDLYSFLTGKVEQGGSRRGALMLIMEVWHPDIEHFIHAKRKAGTLDNANISVALTDDFMAAVENDADWDLVFPDRDYADYDAVWDGDLAKWRAAGRKVNVYRTVKARVLYDQICQSAWQSAEPGIFFIDRANQLANSYYYCRIACTNPCAEEPLPPNAVCNLGALNLAMFGRATAAKEQFWPTMHDGNNPDQWNEAVGRINMGALYDAAQTAAHFLDNVIDATPYFAEENRVQQQSERRVGLGVMGTAELLVRIGVPYGSKLALRVVEEVFRTIRDAAYNKSTELAKLKGVFPCFHPDKFLNSGYAQTLPDAIRYNIRMHGIRNVTLLTVAPTGTTGTMMGTSTGIEPYFMFRFERRGRLGAHTVNEPVVDDFLKEHPLPPGGKLPSQFQTTEDLSPQQHAELMAAAQKYVDAAISKTCNLPRDFTVADVAKFYQELYRLGCKGGTVYRDGSHNEQVLVKIDDKPKEAPKVTAVRPTVKPLPQGPRPGFTHSLQTPLGRVHVTTTFDPTDQEPFDVFVTLSKAGSETDADTEAIGRLLSLLLRIDSPLSPRKRLQLAVEQLKGIATSRTTGVGPQRVRSVPDGIARCIEATTSGTVTAPTPATLVNDDPADAQATMQICPSCGNATAVYAEGCFHCIGCGYSEC